MHETEFPNATESPAVGFPVQRPVRPATEELCALLRGAALDNHAMYEAKAEAACLMGVGCGTAGVCYAERMGRPELCRRAEPTNTDTP